MAPGASDQPARDMRAVNGVIERRGIANELQLIKAPTLILVGEEDLTIVPAKAEAIHAAINGSRLVRIPAAGHIQGGRAGGCQRGLGGVPRGEADDAQRQKKINVADSRCIIAKKRKKSKTSSAEFMCNQAAVNRLSRIRREIPILC